MMLVLLLMYVAWVIQIYPAANMPPRCLYRGVIVAIIMHATMLMCCTSIGHTTCSTLAVCGIGEEAILIPSITL